MYIVVTTVPSSRIVTLTTSPANSCYPLPTPLPHYRDNTTVFTSSLLFKNSDFDYLSSKLLLPPPALPHYMDNTTVFPSSLLFLHYTTLLSIYNTICRDCEKVKICRLGSLPSTGTWGRAVVGILTFMCRIN